MREVSFRVLVRVSTLSLLLSRLTMLRTDTSLVRLPDGRSVCILSDSYTLLSFSCSWLARSMLPEGAAEGAGRALTGGCEHQAEEEEEEEDTKQIRTHLQVATPESL